MTEKGMQIDTKLEEEKSILPLCLLGSEDISLLFHDCLACRNT